MKKIIVFISLLVLISVLVSACGQNATTTESPKPTQPPAEGEIATESSQPDSSEPKILRVRIFNDIQNVDPAFVLSKSDAYVGYSVFEGLVEYKPNTYEVVNKLAEKIEPSEDGLEIYFKLREGIQCQKGYGELTSEDVKYSYERMVDPEVQGWYYDDWAALDHVEVISKYEGKIILSQVQSNLWTTTLPMYSGLVVCKKQVEEVGLEAFATNFIGTGPYMLSEWLPNEKIILKRNPDYWGEVPYWDEIDIIPIEDDKAAEIALEAGELDLSRIPLASIERLGADPNFKVKQFSTLTYSWVGMNIANPKLKDINVRQAIRYGIDVDSILLAAYLGKAERAYAMIPPGLLGHWQDAPVYQRDVAKAKEYLAKAGLESLDLELAVLDTAEYRTWAEVIQQNLAEVGINITINAMDASTLNAYGQGEDLSVELMAGAFASQPDPAWYTMWFICDQIGIYNLQRWCSPEFDELHQQGLLTTDPDKRQEIYDNMQKLFDEAVAAVWVTYPPEAFAWSPKIEPAFTPNGEMLIHQFMPAK